MAAAVHTAPQGEQIRHIEIAMQGWNTQQMAVDQMPECYRL
ncbi:Uncharacterised protein [uncultured archaeon]|nr:Uncharacterised protein [uncultured archaeon]